MDSLQITTGDKHIPIVRNGENVGEIVFNPADSFFREKFYRLIDDFKKKLTEYQSKGQELENNSELDSNNLPVNMGERLALEKESCEFIRAKIDELFGAGTSQLVFGDAMVMRFNENLPGPFEQFFTGIVPFVQQAGAQRIEKYIKKPKRNGKHSR